MFLAGFVTLALLSSLKSTAAPEAVYLSKPARVFDGLDPRPHDGCGVLVRGESIEAVGRNVVAPTDATLIELPGETLIPGLIEGHSHVFLHPYNEAPWDDQVLREPLALRIARATVAAKATLMAGFTTVRDLGTEGAGYSDVGLKQAIEQASSRGRGCWSPLAPWLPQAPKGFEADVIIPQGAEEEADGPNLATAARHQIGAGADVVKLYADYCWRPGEPTFSEEEMRAAIEVAHSAGRIVASTRRLLKGCDVRRWQVPTR